LRRERLQIAVDVDQQLENRCAVLDLLGVVSPVRQQLEATEETYRGARGDRPDLDAAFAEQPGGETMKRSEQRPQEMLLL
jgi:hypothetical protein